MECRIIYAILATGMSACCLNAFSQRPKAELFDLKNVRLLSGPFLDAQKVDENYILSLDEDRLLAPFLKDAGYSPLKPGYGNWESDGLDGHIAGHYLSAVAQMYAATGRDVFKKRLDYMLSWLHKCQQKDGNGYVGGVPNGKKLWDEIKKGNVEAVWSRWVPWYNIHKLFSGLVDAYHITGSKQAKDILLKLAAWCSDVTASLSDGQMQRMLGNEQGGMNEALANVYVISGNPAYLALAQKFTHRDILRPLLNKQDSLDGLHANTQIPKVVGIMRIASLDSSKAWADAADFFWQTVTGRRSVIFGGNSVREHFNPADDFEPVLESREGPETCNSYNMLKLTKELYLANPTRQYIDYYERTLYNHILSSQSPKGGFVYFTPIRPNHYRVYSTAQNSFWCCVGSGMENHGKYGELIYAHTKDQLYVNLFIDSKLTWREKHLILTQRTAFPFSENARLYFRLYKPGQFTVKFRSPSWAQGGIVITVNGQKNKAACGSDGYVSIKRVWKNSDVVDIGLPMHTAVVPLPDSSHWAGFMHGPIVLAAPTDTMDVRGLYADGSRWGHIAGGKLVSLYETPFLVTPTVDSIKLPEETDASELVFNVSKSISKPLFNYTTLIPFFLLHEKRYIMYWPYASKEDIPVIEARTKEKEAARQRIDSNTIDKVYPGEQQPESDHNFQGENSNTGTFKDRHFRNGKGWFAYDLRNAGQSAKFISLTIFGADKDKGFEVYLNGVLSRTVRLTGDGEKDFQDYIIEIPGDINAEILKVKFTALRGEAIANIYEVRLLKGK